MKNLVVVLASLAASSFALAGAPSYKAETREVSAGKFCVAAVKSNLKKSITSVECSSKSVSVEPSKSSLRAPGTRQK